MDLSGGEVLARLKPVKRLGGAVALLALVFTVSACQNPDNRYGKTWRNPEKDRFSSPMTLPENAPSVSNYFYFNDTGRAMDEHRGIDVVAEEGTAVLAAAPGVVSKSFLEPMYGNTIEIDHGKDEEGRAVRTVYKHLSTREVEVGQKIQRGQRIAGLGRTGVLSGGLLHLHFEYFREDARGYSYAVDPNLFWVNGSGNVTCFDKRDRWKNKPTKTTFPVVCKGMPHL